MSRFYDFLPGALAEGQPFALGIISGIKGSSPQKKGAKALFLADGRIKGTLGGGCLEAEIQDRARRALLTQTPATFALVLDHDFGGNTVSRRLLGEPFEGIAAAAASLRSDRHPWASTRRAGAARLGAAPVCFSRADWQQTQTAVDLRAVRSGRDRDGSSIGESRLP